LAGKLASCLLLQCPAQGAFSRRSDEVPSFNPEASLITLIAFVL
jgi:hypothetical protein